MTPESRGGVAAGGGVAVVGQLRPARTRAARCGGRARAACGAEVGLERHVADTQGLKSPAKVNSVWVLEQL